MTRIAHALWWCLVLPSIAVGQESTSRDELIEMLREVVPPDTETDLRALDANGFRVQSSRVKEIGREFEPSGRTFELLIVTADGLPRVVVEKGREAPTSGGVGMFHGQSGKPMLSAADHDGDGVFDILTYTVMSESGEPLIDVIDYEADGQPDMRIHFTESYFELWHQDRWYQAENRDGRRGIVVDGRFVELEMRNNRWVVP